MVAVVASQLVRAEFCLASSGCTRASEVKKRVHVYLSFLHLKESMLCVCVCRSVCALN